MKQTPPVGTRLLCHRGDTVAFSLELPEPQEGAAWLRTNLGNARLLRREVIRRVESDEPCRFHDWRDVPLRRVGPTRFETVLPLLEVGRFEAKAFFLPSGEAAPRWPEGDNVVLKVEPASTLCANMIYTAFVRQFGPNKHRRVASEEEERKIPEWERKGYAVIPPSGTFRDLVRELDFIMGKLRFRILQLLPIHPIPSVYAKMGRFGSPFAALDFMSVDPALAEFDRRTTPLDQFRELLDAVHLRGGKLFMDIPINHTGWASRLHLAHPEWFRRNEDGTFRSPGAWGVVWEDLLQLDHGSGDLWRHLAEAYLFWCDLGVDGFRCDAGYLVPFSVWEYLVAKVRDRYPDTIFLLEGLGGDPRIAERLLDGADLDWAYSELFQNYTRSELEHHLPGYVRISSTRGTLVHFAETHDNDRIASRSHQHARLRTALAALCSHGGAFGITNGVEWFAGEKLDVHGMSSLNWGSPEHQVEEVARLNAILETHPAFLAGSELRLWNGGGETLVLERRPPASGGPLWVVVNLDEERPATAVWRGPAGLGTGSFYDLISGKTVRLEERGCPVGPGGVLCLSEDGGDLERVEEALERVPSVPLPRLRQAARAKMLEVYRHYREDPDLSDLDPDQEIDRLLSDPDAFCARAAGREGPAEVTPWVWPQDARRVVMIAPGEFLRVRAPQPFSARLLDGQDVLSVEESLPDGKGSHFALLLPIETPEGPRRLSLALVLYAPGRCDRSEGSLLYLPRLERARVRRSFSRAEVRDRNLLALCANGSGAVAQLRGAWGTIRSQYDAWLSVNWGSEHPVDRRVLLTRLRGWLVHLGYSQPIDLDRQESFAEDGTGNVRWHFSMPVGHGKLVGLEILFSLDPERDAVRFALRRRRGCREERMLEDDRPVSLIWRPDLEDRGHHEKTKAYAGPEHAWPGAVRPIPRGWIFAPAPGRALRMVASRGEFVCEPQWTYGVPHPEDADRGLEGVSDLFSPGYFRWSLLGGEEADLRAELLPEGGSPEPDGETASTGVWPGSDIPDSGLREAARRAMERFVFGRGEGVTVLAGYPWFLDWGRDTLIFVRGMVAAGMLEEARRILKRFARFERQGTLPNVLRGGEVSNRDTADAPLWLLVACRDLLKAEGDHAFLDEDCGGRPVREVLRSIASSYVQGTPNGIRMDPESGLIFSPAHFTWMDTNHPAGTPREGYPVEIQALWHAALAVLSGSDPGGPWMGLAVQVRASITKFFPRVDGYLSDCLHAGRGTPAREAAPDDALRPNQLLAITLGAIDDPVLCGGVIACCEELLVPGGIRSLADRPVSHPLPISWKGRVLNDPNRPYQGSYRGDEDTSRKPAYHNGTAWTWLFPSYGEALFMTYGECRREKALAILGSGVEAVNQGCVGQVPEILDGDAPHAPRGCHAQAWGVSELFRVLERLGGQ
jgi:predicted glycogen debranching enzyme